MTLYTKLRHDKLTSKLSSIVDFAFKGTEKPFLGSLIIVHLTGERKKRGLSFSKTSLKAAINHLINNCYFNVGNLTMKKAIRIPMGIDPTQFWANLFLYSYENQCMSSLISSDKIKARHFHSTKHFIDDLCAINDDGDFGRSICNIYPKELESKVEQQRDHATFLNLDVTIKNGAFLYKSLDKRDLFPFSVVRMPHIESNITQNIFYSAINSEF